DAGQSEARHQPVEQREGDRQPEDLGGEGRTLEGREGSGMPLGGLFGALMRGFSHETPSQRRTEPAAKRPPAPNRTPHTAKRSRSAIRSEKMPSASVRAKPSSSVPRWPSAAEGLRRAPERNWPKSVPRPMPAPAMPRQASPAPIYLAATGS